MNWPLAILALLLGVLSLAILKLANVSHLDTSAEAVHVMGKLRDALQRCESTKRQVNFEAPAPMPAAPPIVSPSCPRKCANEKRPGGSVGMRPSDLGKPLRCGALAYS